MKTYNDNQVTDLFIDLYNEQIDYLTTKDIDYLETFDQHIGETPIKYDINHNEIQNQIDSFIIINNNDDLYYYISEYNNILNWFNIDIWDIYYNIDFDYYKIDNKILNAVFNDCLNIEVLEDLHKTIFYYDLDAVDVLRPKLVYNSIKGEIIGTDLISNLLGIFQEEYAFEELQYEIILTEINQKVDAEITKELQNKINQYNRYNIPVNLNDAYYYVTHYIKEDY